MIPYLNKQTKKVHLFVGYYYEIKPKLVKFETKLLQSSLQKVQQICTFVSVCLYRITAMESGHDIRHGSTSKAL